MFTCRYNFLFKFLLTIKRVELELQLAWAPNLQQKQLPKEERAQLMNVWLLRKDMSLLIDHLLFFFQADVLQTQFSELLQTIEESVDFTYMKKAHDDFLDTSIAQCFLQVRTISRCFDQIFRLCLSFCQLIQTEPREELVKNEKVKELSKVRELPFDSM